MAPSRQVASVPKMDTSLGREMAGQEQVEALYLSGAVGEDPHPSTILRDRSEPAHRIGELYDSMLDKDTDLAAYCQKRVDSVLALPRLIKPFDSSPRAMESAQLCRTALEEIPDAATNWGHQFMATFKGVSHDEEIWEKLPRGPLSGAWVPVDLKDRPMWRFAYKRGVLHIKQAGAEPVKAPPLKILSWTRGTKDSPWGKPLLDQVYWYWHIKRIGWKFFAVFLEKWAQPTTLGRYPHAPGDSPEAQSANEERQGELLSALQAIQNDQSIVIPEGLSIDLLEAARSGSVSYESFIDLCTRGEAVLILGEVDTSGSGKQPGSYAKSAISNEVRLEKLRRDAHELGAHLRDRFLRPIVRINLGPDAPVPHLVFDSVEAEDRELRQTGIERVREAGQPIPRRYFYSTHQVPEPEDGEEVIEGTTSAVEPAIVDPTEEVAA